MRQASAFFTTFYDNCVLFSNRCLHGLDFSPSLKRKKINNTCFIRWEGGYTEKKKRGEQPLYTPSPLTCRSFILSMWTCSKPDEKNTKISYVGEYVYHLLSDKFYSWNIILPFQRKSLLFFQYSPWARSEISTFTAIPCLCLSAKGFRSWCDSLSLQLNNIFINLFY